MSDELRAFIRPATASDGCEREPVHTPSVIQGDGAVLVVDADTHRITHPSANVEEVLGRMPGSVFCRPLEQVIGKAAIPLIGAKAAEGAGSIGKVIGVHGSGEVIISLLAHRTGMHGQAPEF